MTTVPSAETSEPPLPNGEETMMPGGLAAEPGTWQKCTRCEHVRHSPELPEGAARGNFQGD